MTRPTVRFAPSPTGLLHVGNARMALVNWLYARHHGGRFILRLDDTDAERSRSEYAAAILEDLAWLGLDWEAVEHQSARLARYEDAFERLRTGGRIYPCYETAEELEFMRKRQRARGRPPIYDRAALQLDGDRRHALEAEGRQPHWRFKLDHSDIAWDDMVRGATTFHGANLSDPVIRRADGTFLYMLPSTVDDIDMGITHVVRGEDHVTNTAVQAQIFEALDSAPPAFGHLPLLAGSEGGGLSKRTGGLSLQELREDGVEPLALANYLAHLGSGEAGQLRPDLAALAEHFDIAAFGRATPRYDPVELGRLNARVLHETPFEQARPRLAALGMDGASPAFWEAVRPNLESIADARAWYDVCYTAITPVIEDADFAATAARLLPEGEPDEATWKTWTAAVKAETGRKGKALFLPLRRALTGHDHGPELGALLPLIGRERALARLRGEAA